MPYKTVPVDTDKTVEEFTQELHIEAERGEVDAIVNITFFVSGLVRGSMIGDIPCELLESQINILHKIIQDHREQNSSQ
ncbi:hypothetical protein [Methylobacterium frigidaeris]|uniref:hypothetical protein n=1 Tax=Methylobacterium frigidaeris TaxID=2038277 RepID=UPI001EE041FC|nr:hypothetical protein [Methylobacterium frigidaeris]